MKKTILFVGFAALLAACGKDKFQTVPQVEIKSLSPKNTVLGDVIVLTANVTDKEGDVQDSALFCRKKISLANFVVQTDTIRKSLKELGIPSAQEYQLNLSLKYGQKVNEYEYQPNSDGVDRKLTLGVIVRDKAGNRSTYVESDTIILKKI